MTKTIKIEEWEKEFNEKFACSCGDEDCDWLGNFYGSELKRFITKALSQVKKEEYERGFIDGGDASKTQESEIIICQLKEAEAKGYEKGFDKGYETAKGERYFE